MNELQQDQHIDDVHLNFVGDIFLGANEMEIDDSVRAVLSKADLVIGNLESPITSQDPTSKGKIALRSDPGQEKKLVNWGFDMVTLANNHMFDCGMPGLAETTERLDNLGIAYLGAGADLATASRPVIREIKGIRIGFLTYAGQGTQAQQATDDQPGCSPLDEDLIFSQITELKKKCEQVIVMPHWGFCDYEYPTKEVYHLGHRMISHGATAVIGHHSHVVQGILCPQENRLISYSLGNFIFNKFQHDGRTILSQGRHAQGLILSLELGREGVAAYHTIFTKVVNQTDLEIDSDNSRQQRFKSICEELQRADYEQFWTLVVRKRLFLRALYWACPWNWRHIRKATITGFFIMLSNLFTTQEEKRP